MRRRLGIIALLFVFGAPAANADSLDIIGGVTDVKLTSLGLFNSLGLDLHTSFEVRGIHRRCQRVEVGGQHPGLAALRAAFQPVNEKHAYAPVRFHVFPFHVFRFHVASPPKVLCLKGKMRTWEQLM